MLGVGEAYLFEPASGLLVRTLINPTPQANDEFGVAIVDVGGNLLIGAPGDDSQAFNSGAAYLISPSNGQVICEVGNPNPTFPDSRFGSVLAATGLRALVGDSI